MTSTEENWPDFANKLGIMPYRSIKREQKPSTRIYWVLGPLEGNRAGNTHLCLVWETDPQLEKKKF